MGKPVRFRSVVALLAAYVVALQALLLPLSVVAAKASFDGSLCTTFSAASQAPVTHDTGCPCAAGCGMQCCAQGLHAPAAVTVPQATEIRTLGIAFAIAPATRTLSKGVQAARGPPA